ncbi:MAG: YebC/PmpR family DNA-binding transcriptional regulator [Erysipelotrichaceae bacterium]|jgi:YebC/PmpR family DNA-binding regulatory protein|nr:YebC/PmpR family DNA-binding transcriptional regulator [Erysipelotrichaceae bacterium]
MGRAFEVRKAAMAKTADAKAKVYSRYGKEIYIAAKNGVPDPEMNVALKRVIDKAKANQVPADVIKRAVEKAKGAGGENYESVRYEGFGPGSSTVIVDCLTDNTNRTYAEVRNCFTKSKAKLGAINSVSFMYDNLGILSFAYDDEEKILEVLIEADVDVTELEVEDGMMSVYVAPTDLYKAKEAIEAALGEVNFEVLEISMLPKEYVTLDGEDVDMFHRLTSMLDQVDDVQQVYHNVTGL